MQTVNIHDAKTNFSKLVDAAASGEEIIIAKAGTPTARLVPMQSQKTQRIPGAMKGKIKIAEDFDATLRSSVTTLERRRTWLPDAIKTAFEGD